MLSSLDHSHEYQKSPSTKLHDGRRNETGARAYWREAVRYAGRILPVLVLSARLFGQSNTAELQLEVSDPQGLGLRSSVELVSEANQFQENFITDSKGSLTAKLLPFGLYHLAVQREGFAAFSQLLDVRSVVPTDLRVTLSIASVNTSVMVNDEETLIDPYRTASIHRIGSEIIETRTMSLPGRSLQDLVNSQPGWLYEGNAVLHPRGSEYQTQFVVDGIPLADNRSPSFGPEIEADDVQSLSVFTAGVPAEYGRKMGGVVEVNTKHDIRRGMHGQLALYGGSYRTGGAFGAVQYGWGKNTLGVSANGEMTEHYLNPPVLENYTNSGTTGDFSASYERELSRQDRLGFSVRRALARFQVPNELIQQAAGQRQDGNNFETMGTVSYTHIFSPDVLGDVRGMIRDDSKGLTSNPLSTPVMAFSNNGFREGYFKASISIHHGVHEWKAGVESDAMFLREGLNYAITDPTEFDPATPATFAFSGHRPDLEQSAYVQDLVRLGRWTVSAGLRWDHYQLVVNQNAVSPRVGISRYFPAADLVVHPSYDRVFQTPAFDGILLSSSDQVASLSDQVLRLPVEPSHGNYYEAGVAKGFAKKLSLETNVLNRIVNNFGDNDVFFNTGDSFPIAFRKAKIYGAEGKVEIPRWGRISGFASYSYMVGAAYLPVTGGLFLGDDAANAVDQIKGRFWVTQDQRNTVRTRFRFELAPRAWVAFGAEYGSGLPVEFTGTHQDALDQYGKAIVNRVNFDTGRVRPSLALNASVGADVWKNDRAAMRVQCDVQNINNRLNVIDFGGLFSGNAIAPARSWGFVCKRAFKAYPVSVTAAD